MPNVTLKTEAGVAILSVDRPEALNALSREIVDEIDKAVELVKKDDSVRVLLIYSEKNFAAGADIKGMVACNKEAAKAFSFSETFNKIADLEIPTIAAIDGYALGGGLELALTCDLRIAAETARLGFPETGLGIMPGAGGTIRAPRLVGASKAMELILLTPTLKAEAAKEAGLVNKVVPAEDLLGEAMKWASKLAKGAPIALRTAKKIIKAGVAQSDVNTAVAMEAEAWAALFETQDQKEGMTAFIEKRKPSYTGK